jgi:dethiobiotin synthetase
MTPWPDQPSVMEQDNRATVAQLGEVEVATLPALPRADVALLATAGAQLPLDRWVG